MGFLATTSDGPVWETIVISKLKNCTYNKLSFTSSIVITLKTQSLLVVFNAE